jgi:hypothetical protein
VLDGFFIGPTEFRVILPDISFIEKAGDEHNTRQIKGIMSTSSLDRQGEKVLAKGLDMKDFLAHGHFNDNHSQDTSAIVGYPEAAEYSDSLTTKDGRQVEGWVCRGYVLKGTRRADEIWELAKSLSKTPDKRLGFSIEGKVERRKNNVIEKARIRHLAITNCPVNTDATWDVLAKSFFSEEVAMKSLTAGYGAGSGPAAQSGGSALGSESLDHDDDPRDENKKRRKTALKIVTRSLIGVDIIKAIDYTFDLRPDFTDEAGAEFVRHLIHKEQRYGSR